MMFNLLLIEIKTKCPISSFRLKNINAMIKLISHIGLILVR